MLIWILILASLIGWIGSKYGVKYLFLTPEYVGEVSWLSFFLVGIAMGSFLFSWDLSIYLLSAFRFPFLATLRKPFTKFCINNSLLPLGFIVAYIAAIIMFHHGDTPLKISILYSISLLGGLVAFVTILLAYFRLTNKDIFSFLKSKHPPPDLSSPILSGQRLSRSDFHKINRRSWRVDTFINEKLRWRLARGIGHYDIKLLMRVFRQNHINVLLVQLFMIILLMGFGLLMENKYFRIPAAASMFILGSIVISMIGAIAFWFKRWKVFFWILILISINQITKTQTFNSKCKAYGMDYATSAKNYNSFELASVINDSIIKADLKEGMQALDNWKNKHTAKKPKMVVIATSGGGIKSALWTFQVMRTLDSLSAGKAFEHTTMISGASGGMLGAAYYRELMLQQKLGKNINPHASTYLDNISKDMFNSIAFSILTNDLFIPLSTGKKGLHTYRKDRGYMFELQFNENTNFSLDKPLADYYQPEMDAIIPRMIITPSIINDGRRLFISPMASSYMLSSNFNQYFKGVIPLDGVGFKRFFANHSPDSLNFVSALRMNATYPIVLPMTYLPSSPNLEVADAGFRDNLGKATALRYVNQFKDWIKENTSGVLLIQIVGWPENEEIVFEQGYSGWLESLYKPFGFLTELSDLQSFDSDFSYGLLADIIGNDQIELIKLTYIPAQKHARASMSLHLTEIEKNDIIQSIKNPENVIALEKISRMLD